MSPPGRWTMSPPTPPINLTGTRARRKRLTRSLNLWDGSGKNRPGKRIRKKENAALRQLPAGLSLCVEKIPGTRLPVRIPHHRSRRRLRSAPAEAGAAMRSLPTASVTTAPRPPAMPRMTITTRSGRSTRPPSSTAKRTFSPPASRNTCFPSSPLCFIRFGEGPAALPLCRKTTKTWARRSRPRPLHPTTAVSSSPCACVCASALFCCC